MPGLVCRFRDVQMTDLLQALFVEPVFLLIKGLLPVREKYRFARIQSVMTHVVTSSSCDA